MCVYVPGRYLLGGEQGREISCLVSASSLDQKSCFDQGVNLDEAESCIRKACDLSKAKNGHEADLRMLISLARVQIKRGDKQHAKVSIRKVQGRVSELSDFERREFEEVKKGVR